MTSTLVKYYTDDYIQYTIGNIQFGSQNLCAYLAWWFRPECLIQLAKGLQYAKRLMVTTTSAQRTCTKNQEVPSFHSWNPLLACNLGLSHSIPQACESTISAKQSTFMSAGYFCHQRAILRLPNTWRIWRKIRPAQDMHIARSNPAQFWNLTMQTEGIMLQQRPSRVQS